MQRHLRPVPLGIELRLQHVARAQHAPRQRSPADDQRPGRENQRQLENLLRPARGFAQRARKRDLERRETAVGVVDARAYPLERARIRIASRNARVQLLGGAIELRDPFIALRPDSDRAAHEADVAKAPEQHDHPVDVVGIVLAGNEPCASDCKVGRILFQLEPRPVITHRNCDRFAVGTIVRVGARLRIAEQAVDGLLLRLRPQTFPADVRAARRNDPEAFVREKDEHDADGEKRPGDSQQPGAAEIHRCRFPRVAHGLSRGRGIPARHSLP